MGFWRRRRTERAKLIAHDKSGPAELGAEPIAHWGFAAGTEHSWVHGQLLLRADGVLLRRYGGDSYSGGMTTYSYRPWDVVPWWPGTTDPNEAIGLLRRQGYDLYKPDPVPPDQDSAGPFPYTPGSAEPI
jgi:hypothetical protein